MDLLQAFKKPLSIDIDSLRAPMFAAHESANVHSYAWRRQQLFTLQRLLKDHRDDFAAALKADLGKHYMEAIATEICTVEKELSLALSSLHSWMRPKSVGTPGVAVPARSRIEPRPLRPPGVLIIGPSNYPLSLCLLPAIGSLAAGNPTLIKPSELCPSTAYVMHHWVTEYFPAGALQVVEGGVPETTALLKEPWAMVFFTGSERVGRKIAAAAAETTTPTVLELGGKSPCYVDSTTPRLLEQVADRIIWAKTLNAGQTCAAIDYLVIHADVAEALIDELKLALVRQFTDNPKTSELGRIVQPQHAERLVRLIAEAEAAPAPCRVVHGSSKECDAARCYVAPTLIVEPPGGSRLVGEEIFGPILPIFIAADRASAMRLMRHMSGSCPLCLYVFTNSESVLQTISRAIPSGSVVRNDALIHLASTELPFGGLGSSGYGRYHGYHSFETFSHQLSVLYRPVAPGADFGGLRYHPFTQWKGELLTKVLMHLPHMPVIPTVIWMIVGGAMAKYLAPVSWQIVVDRVADALAGLADWLRRKQE